MPIYEFVCGDCRKELELLVRAGESPVCDACGSTQLEKLLSIPAAHSASSTSSGEACSLPQPGAGGSCGSGCGCFPGGM